MPGPVRWFRKMGSFPQTIEPAVLPPLPRKGRISGSVPLPEASRPAIWLTLPAETPASVETSTATETVSDSATSTDSTQSESNQTTDTNLSSSEAAAKEEIAQRESSGSYTAQNGQYYGRYQLAASYLNGDLSPENQEKVADNYVASRYGSWTAALAFWNANGWY